jgi:hypothetical protein
MAWSSRLRPCTSAQRRLRHGSHHRISGRDAKDLREIRIVTHGISIADMLRNATDRIWQNV